MVKPPAGPKPSEADGARRSGARPGVAPLISVHIPKTAGITFHDILARMYGKRLHLDYGPDPYATTPLILKTVYSGDGGMDALVRAVRGDRVRCIHGHFPAEKYAALFPDADLVAWVRDPVERVVSEYFFRRGLPRPMDELDRLVQEGILNLGEFAERDDCRDRQSRMLSGVPPERFAFIGVCERFEESIRVFSKAFGVRIDPRKVKSRNRNRRKPVLHDEALKERIRSLNEGDEALVRLVRERVGFASRS